MLEYITISTHDLTKRSTEHIKQIKNGLKISTHDLTKRSTGDSLYDYTGRLHFNSRPHEEVDLKPTIISFLLMYFNSRPHEEVDKWLNEIGLYSDISTHDLTKRSTAIFTQKVFLSKLLFVLIAYNIFILH